jgi:hypothetical protein
MKKIGVNSNKSSKHKGRPALGINKKRLSSVQVNLRLAEYNMLLEEFGRSDESSISDYLRKIVLEKIQEVKASKDFNSKIGGKGEAAPKTVK